MEDRVTMHVSTSKGFSLVETVIAIGVLTTGVLHADPGKRQPGGHPYE